MHGEEIGSTSTVTDCAVALDYHNAARKRMPIPISGVLSAVCMAALVPWAVGCFFFAWAHAGAVDSLPKPWGTLVLWGSMAAPALLAVILGTYSVITSGAGWRNIMGVVGLTSAAVVVLFAGLYLFFVLR